MYTTLQIQAVTIATTFNIQAVYAQRNIQARSRKHCCSGKAISTTYSECVYVALLSHHALRVHHLVIRGLSEFIIFSPIIS
jgi:hypothetical protein